MTCRSEKKKTEDLLEKMWRLTLRDARQKQSLKEIK